MTDRRRFLRLLGSAIAAISCGEAVSKMRSPESSSLAPSAQPGHASREFFTQAELRFVEAAVERLIPADDLGPGALAAGVPEFIDHQLAGPYGEGARYYNRPPYGDTGFQGYQLELTPGQLYRAAIAALDDYCREDFGNDFAALAVTEQDEVLRGLEEISNDPALDGVPGTAFFVQLLADAKDGFFSDPVYGGNRDKIGWTLIGFPGVAANYRDAIGRNQPYRAEPLGIADMRKGSIPVDDHGHPVRRQAGGDDGDAPADR